MKLHYHEYNSNEYNWVDKFNNIFMPQGYGLKLKELKNPVIPTVDTDQDSIYHKKYYSSFNEIEILYKRFIAEIIYPLFNEPILYQKIPTFRIHAPGSLGVGEFHRDRDYSHSPKEINVFLPITDAYGTNTIWVETEEGNANYIPLNTPYGGFWLWDGANLEHGNKINTSNDTRISIDFRILPKRFYDEFNIKESVTNKTKMTIGGYWEEFVEPIDSIEVWEKINGYSK